MITILKLAGLSAVLAGGVMTAVEVPPAGQPTAAKAYQDRIAPDVVGPVAYADATAAMPRTTVASDASPSAAGNCREQTWPYVATGCMAGTDGTATRKAVRTITIERRDAPNTSTLIRVPVEAVASR